jgi:polar amino acid transport system substrate-binding protein
VRALFPLLVVLAACRPAPAPAPAEAPDEAAAVDALAAIRARGTLRVGADPTSPPMCFRRPDGSLDGFEVRVAEHVAQRLGVALEIVPVEWDSHDLAVQKGAVDAVIAGWIPNEGVGSAFSAPYLDAGLALAVPKGSSVRGIADLAGKKLGIFDDPAVRRWAAETLHETTVVPLVDGYYNLLVEGQLDAFAYDWAFTLGEVQPFVDDVRIVSLNIMPIRYAALLPPGQPALLAAVNEALAAMRSSEAYRGWLAEHFDPTPVAAALQLPAAEPSAGGRVHGVQEGETLRTLATRYYRDEARWTDLWRANRDRVGFPERLTVGQELVIP